MGRRFSITSIGVIFLVIGFSGLLIAQVNEASFSFTPQVGGYQFSGKQLLDTGITAGIGIGYNFTKKVGAEFSFNYIKTHTAWRGHPETPYWHPIDSGINGYLYRVDVLYHFVPENKIVPFLAGGPGAITLDAGHSYGKSSSFIMNYGGGVKYFLTDSIALRGDVRHVIAFGHIYNNMLYTLGINFVSGGNIKAAPVRAAAVVAAAKPAPEPDSDGDGVVDSKDACPNTPAGVKVNSSGCPFDTDGDGVYDYLDKCPDTPAGVKVNSSGCPLDTDGDGVYDYLDKCPNTPAGVKVNSSGCPLDTDGDGVYDYLDKCPNTPAGVKVNSSGCPLDTDGDGVYDYLDKCPDTPRDLKVDAQGCPIAIKKKYTIALKIEFDHDKADIKPEYDSRLKEVADFMTTYLEVKEEIDGHTDSVGAATYNMKLSQRRAESVRNYLIKNFNISPDRLTVKGFGETQPIADNKTAEGRQQNRRIEAVMNAEKEVYEKR
jgi:OmpA-OmpF porin, OOP family